MLCLLYCFLFAFVAFHTAKLYEHNYGGGTSLPSCMYFCFQYVPLISFLEHAFSLPINTNVWRHFTSRRNKINLLDGTCRVVVTLRLFLEFFSPLQCFRLESKISRMQNDLLPHIRTTFIKIKSHLTHVRD